MSAKYVLKVQSILDKIGKNGTSIAEGKPPSDVKSNEAVHLWHEKQKAIAEYLVAALIKKFGEAREKKAKARVEKLLQLDEIKRVPGTSTDYVFDNVSLNVKISNPRTQLSRAKLMTALATRGVKDIDKIIADAEEETAAPRTLTASTTVE